ncbi:MAG: hypothetical protein EON90_07855 [Brevundimonas sp.]|nr:MAG: hypothetical protein EON90_07855 [Brevundimonas sp.]
MDDELKAMQAASAAIEGLDEQARGRVLRWLGEKFGVSTAKVAAPAAPSNQMGGSVGEAGEEFGDLFHRVGATVDRERALVAAYWLRSQGQAQFAGADVNLLLKDLGYRVSNITDALSSSMNQRPALVIQMKKSGSSKQARKLYKITEAGVRWVEEKITGSKE